MSLTKQDFAELHELREEYPLGSPRRMALTRAITSLREDDEDDEVLTYTEATILRGVTDLMRLGGRVNRRLDAVWMAVGRLTLLAVFVASVALFVGAAQAGADEARGVPMDERHPLSQAVTDLMRWMDKNAPR